MIPQRQPLLLEMIGYDAGGVGDHRRRELERAALSDPEAARRLLHVRMRAEPGYRDELLASVYRENTPSVNYDHVREILQDSHPELADTLMRMHHKDELSHQIKKEINDKFGPYAHLTSNITQMPLSFAGDKMRARRHLRDLSDKRMEAKRSAATLLRSTDGRVDPIHAILIPKISPGRDESDYKQRIHQIFRIAAPDSMGDHPSGTVARIRMAHNRYPAMNPQDTHREVHERAHLIAGVIRNQIPGADVRVTHDPGEDYGRGGHSSPSTIVTVHDLGHYATTD